MEVFGGTGKGSEPDSFGAATREALNVTCDHDLKGEFISSVGNPVVTGVSSTNPLADPMNFVA